MFDVFSYSIICYYDNYIEENPPKHATVQKANINDIGKNIVYKIQKYVQIIEVTTLLLVDIYGK